MEWLPALATVHEYPTPQTTEKKRFFEMEIFN